MNDENKKRFYVNIKAINRDLMEVASETLYSEELIKLQFEAIRSLIDDCEKLIKINWQSQYFVIELEVIIWR